jgi:hypothetical protein
MAETGSTEDSVRFAPGAELTYRLAVSPAGSVRAELAGPLVAVSVPRERFERWLEPEEVSIAAEQPIGAGERLAILIEKDFACLTARPGEDETDLFPNPAEEH